MYQDPPGYRDSGGYQPTGFAGSPAYPGSPAFPGSPVYPGRRAAGWRGRPRDGWGRGRSTDTGQQIPVSPAPRIPTSPAPAGRRPVSPGTPPSSPAPGYPTSGYPAPSSPAVGYPPPSSPAPGYPASGPPTSGFRAAGFPAPGSPAAMKAGYGPRGALATETDPGSCRARMYETDAGSRRAPAYETDAGTRRAPAYETDAGTRRAPAYETDAGTRRAPAYETDAGSRRAPAYYTDPGTRRAPAYDADPRREQGWGQGWGQGWEQAGSARRDGIQADDARTERRAAAPAEIPTPPPSTAGRTTARRIVLLFWLAGLAVPVTMWWQHTTALVDTGSILIAAGRLVGLVAGYTLLTQIVLMARLPGLHKIAGSERMLRWHRDIGALVVVTVVGHALLLVEGYAAYSGKGAVAEGLRLFNDQADMVGAFAAAGIVTTLALLSVRAMRRRLPYELWMWLHRSAYVVVYLGYAHQFSAGQDVGSGSGKIYWAALHVAVILAVLWGRVGVPLLINMYHRLRVAEVVDEGGGTVSIYLSGNRLNQLGARSGQYLRWRFLQPGFISQAHPFSLSAPPNEHWLRITVKAVGRYTARLKSLRPETRVWISAPEGEHTTAERTTTKAVLISAGSGIAPARAMLPDLPKGTVLIYRASSPRTWRCARNSRRSPGSAAPRCTS
jgi:predicted ferric reductase